MSEFHLAIGQFLDYKTALEEIDPDRVLYLALPLETWENKVFQGRFIQKRLQMESVSIMVFDPFQNLITSWIK